MTDGSQWRSSEYSEEAEVLFAGWLREQAAGDAADGDAADFAALCAAHPEREDELCGLRTDWENVGGVVARMGLFAARPAPPDVGQPTPDAPPPVAAAAPAPAPIPEPAATRPRARLRTAVLLAALGAAGTFAVLERRSGQTLAAQRDELAQLQLETEQTARRALEQSEALDGQNRALEARARQAEQAREASERARLDAERAALALAARLELEGLRAEAAELWPGRPGAAAALEAWLRAATALRGRLADPEARAALDAEVVELGRRLERARRIQAQELAQRATWESARAAIARAPEYGGLELAPQRGLVPLGADPATGLWEFAHLATGAPAARDETGALRSAAGDGLTLVLIPATEWRAAFFLARRPLTPGQWARAGGDRLRAPAAVPADELARVLERVGLELATPAQIAAGAAGPAGIEGGGPWPARELDR